MDEESDDYRDDGADSHDGVEWVICDRIADIALSFVVALTANRCDVDKRCQNDGWMVCCCFVATAYST